MAQNKGQYSQPFEHSRHHFRHPKRLLNRILELLDGDRAPLSTYILQLEFCYSRFCLLIFPLKKLVFDSVHQSNLHSNSFNYNQFIHKQIAGHQIIIPCIVNANACQFKIHILTNTNLFLCWCYLSVEVASTYR